MGMKILEPLFAFDPVQMVSSEEKACFKERIDFIREREECVYYSLSIALMNILFSFVSRTCS